MSLTDVVVTYLAGAVFFALGIISYKRTRKNIAAPITVQDDGTEVMLGAALWPLVAVMLVIVYPFGRLANACESMWYRVSSVVGSLCRKNEE